MRFVAAIVVGWGCSSSAPASYEPVQTVQHKTPMFLESPVRIGELTGSVLMTVELRVPRGYTTDDSDEMLSRRWERSRADPSITIRSYRQRPGFESLQPERAATICDPQTAMTEETASIETRPEWQLASCRWFHGRELQMHAVRKWIFIDDHTTLECAIELAVRNGEDAWTAKQRADLLDVCRSMTIAKVERWKSKDLQYRDLPE